jgi:hypothetical protein
MDTTEQLVLIQVIHPTTLVMARLPLDVIKTVFQRALNTWSDIPPELLEFSDHLEKL